MGRCVPEHLFASQFKVEHANYKLKLMSVRGTGGVLQFNLLLFIFLLFTIEINGLDFFWMDILSFSLVQHFYMCPYI